MKLGKILVGQVLFVLLSCSFAMSQTATGSISGVVTDASGAVVPAARVAVTNVAQGITRSVIADAEGRYRVPALIPGPYEVQVQMDGFQTEIRKGIQLTVGLDAVINLALQVGQVEQSTVVTAQAPLVETNTATLSGLVDDKTIRDLPLNGRSFDQLVSLFASAPVSRTRGSTPSTGRAQMFSVSGARSLSNQYVMDGTEVVGAGSATALPGGVLGKNMGVDAVQEFAVLTSNYSAQYGKRMGGVVNIATRSGTNQVHGAAVEFLRNDNLDAMNFFDKEKPEFKRNQFGGNIGGPIAKDRAFYFGTFEGLRESLGLTNVAVVPDLNARQGLLPDPARPGQFINVGVAPGVRPYLDKAFMLPNGRNFVNGTAEAIAGPVQPSRQDYFLVRADYKLSDKDFFMARYNFAQASNKPVDPSTLFGSTEKNRDQGLTLEHRRVYATTINSARFGFTRSNMNSDDSPRIEWDPNLVFLPGAKTVGTILFSTSQVGGSITATGTSGTTDRFFALNQFEMSDQVIHYLGPHSLQMGVQLQRIQHNEDNGQTKLGEFTFAGLREFLLGQADNFRAPAPGGGGNAERGYRMVYFGTYLQDDYKLRPNLTLNLGLRYEFMTVPVEVNDRISNFRSQVVNGLEVIDSKPTLGSPFFEARHTYFAPRVGVAWDISGTGKTAVRAGFGLFNDMVENEWRSFTASNSPFFDLLGVSAPPFPFGFSGATGAAAAPEPDGVQPDLKAPARIQYNFSVQQQITTNTVLTAGYVGSHSYHLSRQHEANTTIPQFTNDGNVFYVGRVRKNPALGRSRFITWDGDSSYHGMQVDLTQRLSKGFHYKVSFVFAKNTDDASIVTSQYALSETNATMDPYNTKRDHALSAFDFRKNFVTNFTYDIPSFGGNTLGQKVLGGWQVGGIVTLTGGQPLTPLTGVRQSNDQARTNSDRPNLKAGSSNNPVLGGPDRYFDPTVYELEPAGFYGNAGRNTIIGPGLVSVDATLVKVIALTERLKLDFRTEFFNLLNRPNFGIPNRNIFNSDRTRSDLAGRISQTVTTSRQIQFGVKVAF